MEKIHNKNGCFYDSLLFYFVDQYNEFFYHVVHHHHDVEEQIYFPWALSRYAISRFFVWAINPKLFLYLNCFCGSYFFKCQHSSKPEFPLRSIILSRKILLAMLTCCGAWKDLKNLALSSKP